MNFHKLSLYNCESDGLPGIMNIRETVVDNISNSNFTENQLLVIIFEQSELRSFTQNRFDSLNKGMQIKKNSHGIIADSIFTNMVQNIKEGTIYQSNVASDGSAIGSFLSDFVLVLLMIFIV